MDVEYFLKRRVEFIRQFYLIASTAYIERKRLIESGEEPFVPPYSEDPEPAFLDEWMEAEESLQVLARTCISMLAAIFRLYFKAWEFRVRIPVDDSFKSDFKDGWLNGYKAYFARKLRIQFENSPINLPVLEEIILVRNRTQHPEFITMDTLYYSDSDLKKIAAPVLYRRKGCLSIL